MPGSEGIRLERVTAHQLSQQGSLMRRRRVLRTHLIKLYGEATRSNLIGGLCPGQAATNNNNRERAHRPTASSSTASAVSLAERSADVPAYPLPLAGTAAATSWYLHVGHCRMTPCFFVCFSSIYAVAHCGQACGTGRCQSENVQRG